MVNRIDLNKCRPYKDFVKWFYCTTIKEQVKPMAKRVAAIYGGTPVVTEFELQDDIYFEDRLSIKKFEMSSKDWASFVLNNRRGRELEC
jgi:hypothetical protein